MSPSDSPSSSPSASPSAEVYSVNFSTDQWKGIYLVKWEGLRQAIAAGDSVGKPFACPSYPIKSVQIFGEFNGATVTIQGSNVPTNDPTFWVLNDNAGTTLSFTSANLKNVRENTYWVRPYMSGGDANTSISVYLLCVTER